MLLDTLGPNLLAGKGVREVCEGAIRAGQNF